MFGPSKRAARTEQAFAALRSEMERLADKVDNHAIAERRLSDEIERLQDEVRTLSERIEARPSADELHAQLERIDDRLEALNRRRDEEDERFSQLHIAVAQSAHQMREQGEELGRTTMALLERIEAARLAARPGAAQARVPERP